MLKKLYIALAVIFVVSSAVYYIYQSPEVATLPGLSSSPTNSEKSTAPNSESGENTATTATSKPTFDTSPLSGSGANGSLLDSEVGLAAPINEPFCTTEPCASTVLQIENAFKNCQVAGVTTTSKNATMVQLKNQQFIQVPRNDDAELDIQSLINVNEDKCDPEPVWVLE